MQQIEQKDYKHLVLNRGVTFIQPNEISFNKPCSQLSLLKRDRTSWGSVFLILVCAKLYKICSIKDTWRVCPVISISSGYGCRIFSFRSLEPSFYKCFQLCLKTVLPALSSVI